MPAAPSPAAPTYLSRAALVRDVVRLSAGRGAVPVPTLPAAHTDSVRTRALLDDHHHFFRFESGGVEMVMCPPGRLHLEGDAEAVSFLVRAVYELSPERPEFVLLTKLGTIPGWATFRSPQRKMGGLLERAPEYFIFRPAPSGHDTVALTEGAFRWMKLTSVRRESPEPSAEARGASPPVVVAEEAAAGVATTGEDVAKVEAAEEATDAADVGAEDTKDAEDAEDTKGTEDAEGAEDAEELAYSPLEEGDVVDNKIIRRCLGERSFGFAFEGEDLGDHRLYTVKVSDRSWSSAAAPEALASAIASFSATTRQLVNLPRHPNLQQYVSSGQHTTRDGRTHLFLVSELLSGGSLRDCLPFGGDAAARVEAAGGARAILRDLAAGLAALHWQPARPGVDDGEPAAMIIHGDLKPENVMRSAEGAWKLVDFGSAVQVRIGEDAEESTTFTPSYASQARLADRRSSSADDVWALGLVGLELVLGRSLLDLFPELGTDAPSLHLSAIAQRVREAIVADAGLGALVGRMLDPRPEARATAEEVLGALGGSAEAMAEVLEARWHARDDDPRPRDLTGRLRDAVRDGRLTVRVDSALVGEDATLAGRLEVRFRTTRGHELVARRRGGMWLDVPSRATSLAMGERGLALLIEAREARVRLEALRGWLNRVGRDGRETAAVLRYADLLWVAGLEGEEWEVGWRLAENMLVAGSTSAVTPDAEGGSWSCAWAERVRVRYEERAAASESFDRDLSASLPLSFRESPTSSAAVALPKHTAAAQAAAHPSPRAGATGRDEAKTGSPRRPGSGKGRWLARPVLVRTEEELRESLRLVRLALGAQETKDALFPRALAIACAGIPNVNLLGDPVNEASFSGPAAGGGGSAARVDESGDRSRALAALGEASSQSLHVRLASLYPLWLRTDSADRPAKAGTPDTGVVLEEPTGSADQFPFGGVLGYAGDALLPLQAITSIHIFAGGYRPVEAILTPRQDEDAFETSLQTLAGTPADPFADVFVIDVTRLPLPGSGSAKAKRVGLGNEDEPTSAYEVLRELLENPDIQKHMYTLRRDAAALLELAGWRVANVEDVQMQVALNALRTFPSSRHYYRQGRFRLQNLRDVISKLGRKLAFIRNSDVMTDFVEACHSFERRCRREQRPWGALDWDDAQLNVATSVRVVSALRAALCVSGILGGERLPMRFGGSISAEDLRAVDSYSQVALASALSEPRCLGFLDAATNKSRMVRFVDQSDHFAPTSEPIFRVLQIGPASNTTDVDDPEQAAGGDRSRYEDEEIDRARGPARTTPLRVSASSPVIHATSSHPVGPVDSASPSQNQENPTPSARLTPVPDPVQVRSLEVEGSGADAHADPSLAAMEPALGEEEGPIAFVGGAHPEPRLVFSGHSSPHREGTGASEPATWSALSEEPVAGDLRLGPPSECSVASGGGGGAGGGGGGGGVGGVDGADLTSAPGRLTPVSREPSTTEDDPGAANTDPIV